MSSRPKVLLIGGPDVAARLQLASHLSTRAQFAFAGSSETQRPHIEGQGFPYYTFPMARVMSPARDFRSLLALRRVVSKVRPDIVHTFDTKPNFIGRLAAKVQNTPVIVGTVAGLGALAETTQRPWIAEKVLMNAVRLSTQVSDYTIFQTHHDLQFYLSRSLVPRNRVCVIEGSGVDIDHFSRGRYSSTERYRIRECLGYPSDRIVVTMVSRLIRAKGVGVFARAAQRLKSVAPQIEFCLVGSEDRDGNDALSALELSEIADSVSWIGPSNNVADVLFASDIFALPTLYGEGIPRSLLEAAAMELPIIASSHPGCEEALDHGRCGIVLDRVTPDTLAEAVLTLATNGEMRTSLGRAARARAVNRFSNAVIFEELWRTYARLSSK